MAANNPGGAMAAAIDEEVAKFRQIQENLQKVRSDLQIVMGQLAENDMVKQELDLLSSNTNVFKLVGPVLIKNTHEDAIETVNKRIEFITSEKNRLETKLKDLETQGTDLAQKVQKMQMDLQKVTAAAVQQVAAQHAG